MLEAMDLCFRYSTAAPWILDRASLSVARGEVHGLRGPSGKGKTTLARILAGYREPASGRVSVDGLALPRSGYAPVQLVFQHPELSINPHFRVAKALAEPTDSDLEYRGMLGIEPSWLSRFPHELSSGELQRVALSRCLGAGTRYLIADEATTMLDPISQAALWRVLLHVVERRGIGLLVISHDHALLRRVAHRTTELESLRRAKA